MDRHRGAVHRRDDLGVGVAILALPREQQRQLHARVLKQDAGKFLPGIPGGADDGGLQFCTHKRARSLSE